MMNLTLVLALLTLSCGDADEDSGPSGDGGSTTDGGGSADGGTDGGDAGSGDGGTADGGEGDDGGAEGYGVCTVVIATLDDYSMELDVGLQLHRELVQPAKGMACDDSVWVDTYAIWRSRVEMSVYFDAESVEDLDGATAHLQASSFRTKPDPSHRVKFYNNWEGNEDGLILVDHPEVASAWMDGDVTWQEVDKDTARLVFSTLCWPDNPNDADSDAFSCQSFDAAWLEFNCEYTASKAGPVGVSSWVTTPDGDALCTLPE